MNWYKRSQRKRRTQINPNSLRNLTPRKSRVPIDVQTQIIDMYRSKEDGGRQMTMTEISSHFNLNMDAVRRVLNNNNIPIRSKNNLTSSQEQQIFNLYKSPEDGGKGLNFVEIAKYIGKPGYDKGVSGIVKRLAEEEGYSLRLDPHAKTILTSDDINRLLSLWDQGVGVTDIKKTFRIQPEEVYQILDKNGRDYNRSIGFFNPSQEDADYILELLKGGESISSIARLFEASTGTISNWLERKGHREKEVASVNKYVDEAPLIVYMYEFPEDGGLGMNPNEIAIDLDISPTAVITALKRMSIPIRPPATTRMDIPTELRQKIIDLYKGGMQVKTIAGEVGISPTPLNRILFEEEGLPKRDSSEITSNWWANYPGGFEAFLSRFSKERQIKIQNAIGAKRGDAARAFSPV